MKTAEPASRVATPSIRTVEQAPETRTRSDRSGEGMEMQRQVGNRAFGGAIASPGVFARCAPDDAMRLHRQIGNHAFGVAIGRANPTGTPGLPIQREPGGPIASPVPAPVADSAGGPAPPATAGPLPPSSADSGGGSAPSLEGGEQKDDSESIWTRVNRMLDKTYRLRLGSRTLYSAAAGKRFGWSTDKPTTVPGSRLVLGAIVLPPPVGPVDFEVRADVSAHAGGSASFDIALDDVVLEVSVAQLLHIGVDAAAVLVGGPALLPLVLANLATMKLTGDARLRAAARAKVEVGADANALGVLNIAAWPVVPYVQGSIGAGGSIGAAAEFSGPARLEFSMGRLRVVDGSYGANATLEPRVGLQAKIAAGMIAGYGPLTHKHELWRHAVALGAGIKLEAGISGGRTATLSTDGNGDPTVDLEPILLKAGDLLQALFAARSIANDHTAPASTDPNDPGVSANGLGRIGRHGSKPSSQRLGPPLLWLESEHIIPFATGKRLWEVVGLAVPGRGGYVDRDQTTIMIYYGAARVKTGVDNEVSAAFQEAIRGGGIERELRRLRTIADAGHGDTVEPQIADLIAQVVHGLEEARSDATERTIAAVAAENARHTDGNPLSNGQRRAQPGQTEPPLPTEGEIRAAGQTQYEDILSLVTDAVRQAQRGW